MIQSTLVSTEKEHKDSFVTLTVDVMQQLFGFTPRPFQKVAMPHIIKTNKDHCSPILLVHGTGGGKSSTCQTISIIKGGITLVVQNALSLSSDQCQRLSLCHQNTKTCIAHSLILSKPSYRNNMHTQLYQV